MNRNKYNSGFNLIELMIAVAIIGLLAGIAIPSYNSYITSTAESVGRHNIDTLRIFEENYRIEFGSYLSGVHTAGSASSNLTTVLKWNPDDNDVYTYTVTAGSTGNIASSLNITATCDLCQAPIVRGN